MLVFLAEGRLGNQLFQYCFLKTIQKNNEKIITSGFEDLKEVFEIDNIINFNKKNRWIRFFLFRVIKLILTFLSDNKIISCVSVDYEKVFDKYRRESTTYTESKGLIKNIRFVKLGFFQSEKFFDKNITYRLKIKEKYSKNATLLLESIPKEYHKIFVHIRRGDYKEYTVYDKSPILPISYYKKQIDWFLKNKKNCFFIFLSDAPKFFIEKEFGYIKNKLIFSNNHFGVDLAIMTQCKSAILSASSFSWWGSYLMKEKDTVFAPKYWLGFNSKVEYPSGVVPSYATEVEIDNI